MSRLEEQFNEAMFDIYRKAKTEAGYNATVFYQMLCDRGGVATAKYLVNSSKESTGYTELLLRGRLDLTVEAMICEHVRWHELFLLEEIERAQKRLGKYGYAPTSR